MIQSRTHTCGQLRIEQAGQTVTLAGFMENVREVGGSLAFVVLRDFYGITQLVVEDPQLLALIKSLNKESTLQVTGVVRERSSKNPKQPTGDIEVVPSQCPLCPGLHTYYNGYNRGKRNREVEQNPKK